MALSHFSWGYGALARASEDKEVAKALLQLATDERYRKVFYSVVTDKLGEWDSERELHWLSSEYFPFAQEAENDE
ncbi:hypothetical protein NOR53_1355 [gamma proteobacterium NOR5-3]|nr:hypothetical protein NOR53_1355 [gamma proteobacterium NOR5-3]